MPLTQSQSAALKATLVDILKDPKDVHVFVEQIYQCLQAGEFSAAELAAFGKQFFAGVPWAQVPVDLKKPLYRSAKALVVGLGQCFEIVPDLVEEDDEEENPETDVALKDTKQAKQAKPRRNRRPSRKKPKKVAQQPESDLEIIDTDVVNVDDASPESGSQEVADA
jgi:hypothetical protein